MSSRRRLPADRPPGHFPLLLLAAAVSTACLALLGGALVWRQQRTLLARYEEVVARSSVKDAAALVAQQKAMAASAAQALRDRSTGARQRAAGLRLDRAQGPDAAEYVATDAASHIAVGSVIAFAGAEAARQERTVTEFVTSMPAQRAAFEGGRGVSALYLVDRGAQVVSRVPYLGADELRVRRDDADLMPWYRAEFEAPRAVVGADAAIPRVAPDPSAPDKVALRLDHAVWLGTDPVPVTLVVIVPVFAYLEQVMAPDLPARTAIAIVGADGGVAGSAVRDADGDGLVESRLAAELEFAVPGAASRLHRTGRWYAMRVPVPGTRLSALVAVPVATVWANALNDAALPLGLIALLGFFLALLLGWIRHRLLDPTARALQELTDSADLLREVTDGVPGLAVFKVVRDDEGRTTVDHVSKGTAAVLGVPAIAIASDWTQAFEPIDPAAAGGVRANAERALQEAGPWQEEFRVRRRDEDRWVRVEARSVRTAAGVELVGSWRDVTESRRHTEQLADAHRRLIELADGVPGAVLQWRVTDDGRQGVAFVGNRLTEIAGISTSDLYHGLHAFEQVMLAEDVEDVRRARQQAVAARSGYAVEYRVMHPGRGLRWVREEAVSHVVAGCLAAFTVHITDVTQQRREAGELRRAKDEAEQATRAKSVFLATMSHEIRTPMTGISGMIEVLARTVLDADQRQQLSTIADSARALRRILDDVLDFSRIEAGKMTVERRPISLDDVVESTAGLYVAAAEEKGIQLRATVDPRIGELVMGDAVRLRQVIGNMLSNAVKFTQRGSVRLAVVQESVDETKRLVRFEVSDTGVGIPYDVQPKLFAPFERGEHEVTTQVGGTGLGLALVQRIAELMDGYVELRSLPGVGTVIQVRLPFERLHEETSDTRIMLSGLRVAILHDTELDARHLSGLLEGRGATAVVVMPEAVHLVPAGTQVDVLVTGPDVTREAQLALRSRLAPAESGRLQEVRLVTGATLRPEVRGDGGVILAPHARRGTFLRAVAIAAGRDEPDLPTASHEGRTHPAPEVATVEDAIAERRLILVCEDHPIAQRVIEKQLRVLGYTAELHNNGASGLAAWRTGRYGLVLTDLHMPEMDGLTLARRIRAEEQRDASLGRTPIVALSGNAFDEQRVVCVEAGMDDFLAKPAALKELDATLRFWLPPSARPDGDARTVEEPAAMPVTLPAPLSHKALKEALGDDPDVLRQALGEFLDADAEDLALLQAAMDADDRPRVVGSAHRIEGAARMLGAMPYARAAERVKRLFGMDGDADERAEAVTMLLQEGERLRTWISTTRDWFERVTVGASG